MMIKVPTIAAAARIDPLEAAIRWAAQGMLLDVEGEDDNSYGRNLSQGLKHRIERQRDLNDKLPETDQEIEDRYGVPDEDPEGEQE